MEFNLEKIPVIPNLFIKKLIRDSKTYKDLSEELKVFADYHTFDLDYTKYVLVVNILKNNDFFNMDIDIRENLLYDTTFWASLNESRKKTRPNSHEDISDDKKDAYFTKLQKEVFKNIFKNHDSESPSFDIVLSKYILFFFDLSCIKRDRRGKDC